MKAQFLVATTSPNHPLYPGFLMRLIFTVNNMLVNFTQNIDLSGPFNSQVECFITHFLENSYSIKSKDCCSLMLNMF